MDANVFTGEILYELLKEGLVSDDFIKWTVGWSKDNDLVVQITYVGDGSLEVSVLKINVTRLV